MSYTSILASEVDELCAQAETRILDCRDPRSYEQGHLPGALLVSDAVVRSLARSNKEQPVIVYCYHGISSRDLATFLVNYGFSSVFNLEGGWQAWADLQNRLTAAVTEQLQRWLDEQGFPVGNLNGCIANGMTPLMQAAMLAETAFVKMLLEAGADVNLLNDDLNNALWFACVSESTEIIRLLVEYGIRVDNSNVNGATSLIYAASAGKYPVVKQLVEAGADLGLQTLDGFSALDSASTIEILRFLRRQPVAA
jgi:rhodanese-related sulfurtransferase